MSIKEAGTGVREKVLEGVKTNSLTTIEIRQVEGALLRVTAFFKFTRTHFLTTE